MSSYSSSIRRKYNSKQKNNTDKDSDAIVAHTLRDLIDCVSQMGSITQLKVNYYLTYYNYSSKINDDRIQQVKV